MPETTSAPVAVAASRKVASWLTHVGVSTHAFDDTLSIISPLWTVHQLHARIVAKIPETPSSCTLVLQAGSAFQGLQPGQFVIIGVVINGVRHRRAYSPRRVPGHANRFAITVQRQPGGLVSNYLNQSARAGQFIDIEQAAGDFTLPAALPAQVLLLAGGSGITPSMSMLEHLQREAPGTRVTLIYFARSREDRIFGQALDKMAAEWPGLTYVPIDSVANTPTDGSGRASAVTAPATGQKVLSAELLDQLAPGWADMPAYCCGPAPLMDAARSVWKNAGLQDKLHLEAFSPPLPSGDPDARHAVRLVHQAVPQAFEARGNQTILVASETAGLNMKHGCRQGICHECTCRLNSGSVRDLATGERIKGEGQTIRVCISVPMSDLDLESLN